jgi:hypothetical protein
MSGAEAVHNVRRLLCEAVQDARRARLVGERNRAWAEAHAYSLCLISMSKDGPLPSYSGDTDPAARALASDWLGANSYLLGKTS